jgi:hypothetical protein
VAACCPDRNRDLQHDYQMTPVIDFNRIDYDDPRITPAVELTLRRMLAKRDQYLYSGRDHEARGLGTGIWIAWQTALDMEPGTINGDLNG